jgi:hypothetical protein
LVIPKKISIFALLIKKTKTNMKKFFIVMAMVAMCVACGNDKADTTKDTPIVDATEIVPAAATDVIPCAAPGPDAGGKVATEVIPNE